MDEIREAIIFIKKRRRRINEAANDMPVTSLLFLGCEIAVRELGAAIENLESALLHLRAAESDQVIWKLDA